MAHIDSLAALQARIRGRPALEIIFDLLQVENYEAFVHCIHRAIDLVFREIAQNPELKKGHGEDELTIDVVHMLRMMDIDAAHDSKVGGHVDIVVRGPNDYVWLAEAKKHKSDYGWIFQGFQQLNTRYSTGLQGQDSGGLFIYSDQPRVDELMSRWQKHLAGERSDITFEKCPLNDLAFFSTHIHDKTGRPYRVRHIPLPIYFEPKDKKGRN